MEMLLAAVSKGRRDQLYRAMAVLSAVMLLVVAWEASKLTYDNWDETIPVLNLSGGLFYLAVGIGCAHTALRSLDVCLTGEPARGGVIE